MWPVIRQAKAWRRPAEAPCAHQNVHYPTETGYLTQDEYIILCLYTVLR